MALYCGTCGLDIVFSENPYYGSIYAHVRYDGDNFLYSTCLYANDEKDKHLYIKNKLYIVADPLPNVLESGTRRKGTSKPLEPVYVPAKKVEPIVEPVTVALVFQTKGRKFKVSS